MSLCGGLGSYINMNNEMIIEPKFNKAFDFQDGLARVVADGKYGLIDLEGKMVLQGYEKEVEEEGRKLRDALGWTASIMKDSGQLVISASGNEVGFVIFGACTPGS